MDDEIELISDGDGLSVIGDPSAVDRFLNDTGLVKFSQDLGLQKLGGVLNAGANIAQAGSKLAASSGRWLKITPESAEVIKRFGLTPTKASGISHAMAGRPGDIKSWLQVETGTGAFLTNPAVLAGAAGMMAQLARQHEMNEIKNYLARIDEKVDDILRATKDAELAKVVGAGLDIQSALAVREQTGKVDETTWSTVQARTHTITDALGWALLQLEGVAEKLEGKVKIGDQVKAANEAESEVRQLLAVVARCFELQDALDLLRLDRVLDASPDDLDGHRRALSADRQERRERISRETAQLMGRMDAAAGVADSKALLHLSKSRSVVGSINQVGEALHDFYEPLGIESSRDAVEPIGWWDATRKPQHRKAAAQEAGRAALKGVAGAAVAAGGAALVYVVKNAVKGVK